MAAARLPVFPTRQNLQLMKVKLTGAKKGHSLLKKKADALSMRLRALLKNILEAKENVGLAFRDGNFALAEVKYAAGDIKPMVIESVGTAQKRVEIRVDNIAGVKVPVFKAVDTGAASQDHTGNIDSPQNRAHRTPRSHSSPASVLSPSTSLPYALSPALPGLSKGGQQIAKARTTFAKAVDVLVQLATLQTSFVILDEVRTHSPPPIHPVHSAPHTHTRCTAHHTHNTYVRCTTYAKLNPSLYVFHHKDYG